MRTWDSEIRVVPLAGVWAAMTLTSSTMNDRPIKLAIARVYPGRYRSYLWPRQSYGGAMTVAGVYFWAFWGYGATENTIDVNFQPAWIVATTILRATDGGGLQWSGIKHYRRSPEGGGSEDVSFASYTGWPAVVGDRLSNVTFGLATGRDQAAWVIGRFDSFEAIQFHSISDGHTERLKSCVAYDRDGVVHQIHRVVDLEGSVETSETEVAKRTLALAAERGLDGAGLRTLLVDPTLLKTPARLRVDPQNKTLLTEPLDLLGTDTPGLSMST